MERMMNQTTGKLQAEYRTRFLVAAGCVAVSAFAAHLIMLGRAGDHWLLAIVVAWVCGVAGWKLGVKLCTSWKDLKQLEVLRQHGPYDRREFVTPKDAASEIGDGGHGPNMWGTS
jgi:hypothetical protein